MRALLYFLASGLYLKTLRRFSHKCPYSRPSLHHSKYTYQRSFDFLTSSSVARGLEEGALPVLPSHPVFKFLPVNFSTALRIESIILLSLLIKLGRLPADYTRTPGLLISKIKIVMGWG